MSPQSQIAHYRILSKLGEGGMGAVYRATDTKLNRYVAIKVLPQAFAQDAARMQRFEREAQVLASLNHPNIAAIYGIEQSAIVMELVEGADLAGPVPVETAIAYAKQIAAGLEAAHEKGVVHRDLKPANIKVTPDGTVKLLDFGLAKAAEESPVGNTSMSPTMSLAMTQAGMILGTAAYMSPEQARGKPVDKRADIWAFGVVLFEMLTGTPMFASGETITDIIAAVVTREPDWNVLPKDTPPRVVKLLRRCLQKDPKLRLRDIGEARIALDTPEERSAVPPPATPKRAWIPWTIAGFAVAALAAAMAWMRPAAPAVAAGPVHFLVPLPPYTTWPSSPSATEWVPSPDGSNLAMVVSEKGADTIWVRPMNATAAHRLANTEGSAFPFWSPDGQNIGFFTAGKLKRVPVSGGAVQTICDLPAAGSPGRSGDGAAWSKDGYIVFAKSGQPLQRVPESGGISTPLFAAEKDGGSDLWPQFLPDGKHLLYLARFRSNNDSGIYVQEPGSTTRIKVMATQQRAVWAAPGYLLFSRNGTLLAQRMNPRTFQLEGEPNTVADEVQSNERIGRSTFAVSQNGILVYRSGSSLEDRQLYWRDSTGKVLGPVGKPAHIQTMSLSPDQKSVALVIGTRTSYTLSVMDLATGIVSELTPVDLRAAIYSPAWSPDSQRIAHSPENGGIVVTTVASRASTQLTKEPVFLEAWAPDGRSILCRDSTGLRLLMLSLAPGFPLTTLNTDKAAKSNMRISPDGKFVAYMSSDDGPPSIYVASFPSFSVMRQISAGPGVYPEWSHDGKQVFYRQVDGTVISVPLHTGATIEAGLAKPVFKGEIGVNGRFLVAEDGRILSNDSAATTPGGEPTSPVTDLTVVVNWYAGLKR